jgi:hypothetical protein
MRNPRDYPLFVEELKKANYDGAFKFLLKMLKTDPILKRD